MRIRVEQARDADRGCAEAGHTAPVPVSTASADPVLEALSALRAARRRANAAVEAAVEALEARANEPFSASLDPPRMAGEPRELDGKDRSEREGNDGPDAAAGDALARPVMTPPWQLDHPPDTRLLTLWLHGPAQLAPQAGRDAARERGEADEPIQLPELVIQAGQAGQAGDDKVPDAHRRPRFGAGERDRDSHAHRQEREAARSADHRQRAIDKQAERLKRGPLARPDPKKPSKGKENLADKARKLPNKPPPKKPPPKQDKGGPDKGGGGGGGSDPAAAWAANASAKAETVEAPHVDDASRYVFDYTEASSRHTAQTPQQKLDLIASAEKAVPPIEKWDDGELKLPVPDPLPTARLEVEKKCGQSLPPQALPDLKLSPLKSIPQLKTSVYTDDSGGRHVMRETKPGQYNEILTAGSDGKLPEPVKWARGTEVVDTKKKLDGKGSLADKVADLNAKEPRNLDPKGNKRKGAQLTHEKTDMPKQGPKLPPLEGFPKVDTRKVIAKVMSTIDPSARTIADGARVAYPGGSGLDSSFMEDFVPEIKRDLAKEMRKVAGACATAGNALDKKTDAELKKLEADTQANKDAADAAHDDSYKGEKLIYDNVMEHTSGLLDDIERRIDDMAALEEGGFEPDKVKAEQKSVLDANELMVTTWLGRYKTLGENRVKELRTAKGEQENAYEATAELDKLKLRAYVNDKTSDADKKTEVDKETEIDQWLEDRRLELKTVVGPGNNSLIDEASTKIREYKKALTDQADTYVKVVNAWANKRLGIEKHWWNKLIDWIRSILGISKKNKKVWEERSTADNKGVSDKNELELDKLIITHSEGMTQKEIEDSKALNDVQKAMAMSWFVTNKGDSVAALAAGMIASIRGQWQGHLGKEIEDKVLKSPAEIVYKVSEASGVRKTDLHARAMKIYSEGFKGAGTKKNKVYEGMSGLTRVQARALELYYELEWPGHSLKFEAIEELFDVGDMITGSTGDVSRAFTMLEGTAPGTDAYYYDVAIQLYQAMRETAWGFGFGTNKAEIYKLMRGKTAEERMRIRLAFKERYGVELDDMVKGELDDGVSLQYDWQRYEALGKGQTEKADAIGMRGAHGWEDDDPINKAINWAFYKDVKEGDQIYQDIRADVERDAKEAAAAGHPWDTKEFDRQLKKRLDSLDKTFGDLYRYEFDVKPGESVLEAAHAKYFSHDKAKLLIGARRQDFAMESAARISIEHKAAILPDKDEVNRVLELQYRRSFEEKRRDLEVADIKAQQDAYYKCTVKPRSNSKADIDAAKAETEANLRKWRIEWIDPIAKKKRMRALDREAEEGAKETTKTKMWDLKVAYEKDFATGSMFSTGTFEGDVYSATNVRWPWEGARSVDSDKTYALIAGSGYLDMSQQLLFGVKGAGTDEAGVHGAYAGRSKDEIDAAHKKLGERLKKLGINDDPVDWVNDDFSGDELDDLKVEQLGEPITPEEKLAVERERVRLQKESISSGWFGGVREWIASDEIDGMNLQLKALEADIQALEDEKAKLRAAGVQEGDEKWYDKLAKFYDNIDKSTANVKSAVSGARASLQAALSWVTAAIQAIVTIGTIVAGILLTPVTGGASIAIAIAVVGALVTTAATMAAKAVILGGAYGWEDIVQDIAMGLVEAVVAGLTAGYGGKIIGALGLAKQPAENMVAAFVRKTVAHFVTGAIQAAPGAIIGTLIQGGGIGDILGQILQAGLMSAAMGTLTDPVVEHFQASKAMKARTDPAAFERAFKQFQGEHPRATRADLRIELDKMLASHGPAFRDAALQKTLHAELLEGLPPAQRKAFENAKIEVVNERDFARAAGKGATEPAVVVMKDGVPTVVVKAGADIGTLIKSAPSAFEPPQAAATKLARPTEEHVPRPRGASASPDPLAPEVPGGPARKLVLEPFAGPRLDSPIELAHRNPNAQVVATEATIKPSAGEVARAKQAGVTYVPDNKPGHIAVGTVDEIKMRFPIPHERAMQQDFIRRLGELETLHPGKPRGELLQQAMHDTIHHAESLTGYGPYALERLKVGGRMEVVFWEKSVIGELADVGKMRFVDPATGKAYRLELVDLQLRPRGEVAPHSGFGIPEMTHATEVHVARFEKVELGSKLPTGARGPDIVEGIKIGEHSGRPYSPREAGGPVRELDYRTIKFTEKAVDVVERHVRRFDGGGEMELAMVERLRRIARGEIPATDFDRAFYSHELRESVRYRIVGNGEGPLGGAEMYKLWNDVHTATLEDYRIREVGPGGKRTLFHPDIVERFEPGARGARGEPPPQPIDANGRSTMRPGDRLEPTVRSAMERELGDLKIPKSELRGLADHELVGRFLEAQAQEAPRRIAEFRSKLDPVAQVALDELQGASQLHHQKVNAEITGKLEVALRTRVEIDATLDPGTVRVAKDGTLHVSPHATLGDALGHIPTYAAYKRYEGVLGVVRRVGDAVGRVFGRGGPPFGTRAFEAWEEIRKLPARLEARQQLLLDEAIDPLTRIKVETEIRNIQRQIVENLGELTNFGAGRGYVAIEGSNVKWHHEFTPTPGKSLPPLDPSAFPPEVRSKIRTQLVDGKEVTFSFVHDAASWKVDAGKLPNPNGEYIYIVRDVESGKILKVGETSASENALNVRMNAYRTAASEPDLWNRPVQVELHEVVTAGKASQIETDLRNHLYKNAPGVEDAKGFEWDNKVAHRRDKFIGPGTPGEIPKDHETVTVLKRSDTELTIRNGKGEVEVFKDPDPKAMAELMKQALGTPFECPRRELLVWTKDATGKMHDGKPYIARRSALDSPAFARERNLAKVIRAMETPEQRYDELKRVLEASRGADRASTLKNLADALGLESPDAARNMLHSKDLIALSARDLTRPRLRPTPKEP